MIQYELKTYKKPVNVDLGLTANSPTKVKVTVLNPLRKGCVYLDRWKTINGSEDLELRLPVTPEKVLIMISPEKGNNSIKVDKLIKHPLKQYVQCCRKGYRVKEFIRFAQQFSENAQSLSVGTYYSDGGHFRIDYLPVIKEKGRPITTPARISNKTGRIEISKKHFIKDTVAMRMAILLHEYSHFNLNQIQQDEIEADLNALKIYLGLGYPVIEAHKSFLRVFKSHPSHENKERYEYLKTFIDNFDKMKDRICIT